MDKIILFYNYLLKKYEEFFIKLVFYYFKLSGLATINLYIQSQGIFRRKIWKFSLSRFDLIPNLILIIISMIVFSFLYIKKYTKIDINKILLAEFVDLIEITLTFFTINFILIKYCCQREKILFILNILSELKKLTNILKDSNMYKNNYFSDIWLILLIQIIALIIIIAEIIMEKNVRLISYVILMLFMFVVDKIVIQYIILLRFIKKCIVLINNKLLKCKRNDIHAWNLEKTTLKLKNIRKLIDLLKKFCQEISNFYSLPVFLYIADVIVISMLNLFKSVSLLSDESFFLNYHITLSIMTSFILLRKLTRSVSTIINEVGLLFIKFFFYYF